MQMFRFIHSFRYIAVIAATQTEAITKFQNFLDEHPSLPTISQWAMYIAGRVGEDIYSW